MDDPPHAPAGNASMNLGAFSISLAVKDLSASRASYERPLQGMFERNMLTFNLGWNQPCGELASFTDVGDLQRHLKSQRIALATEADESTTGRAHFVAVDPDGNPVLVDQYGQNHAAPVYASAALQSSPTLGMTQPTISRGRE